MIKTSILILIFVGLFLWLGNLEILDLSRDWPLILVIVGLLGIVSAVRKNRKGKIIQDLEKGKISVEEAEDELKKTS